MLTQFAVSVGRVGPGLRSAAIIGGAMLIALSPVPRPSSPPAAIASPPSAPFGHPFAGRPPAIPQALRHHPPGPLPPSQPRGRRRTPLNLSPSSLRLLARLVEAEAGNQPFIGQVAVAAVVLNRLATPGFPKTLVRVIDQPGQFECVTDGTIRIRYPRRAWLAAQAAATGWDPVGHALYYYNPRYIQNRWILGQPVVARIGSQVFAR